MVSMWAILVAEKSEWQAAHMSTALTEVISNLYSTTQQFKDFIDNCKAILMSPVDVIKIALFHVLSSTQREDF